MTSRHRARQYLASGILLASALLTTGSASAEDKIQIGLPVPNYGPYAPILAAQDLGLYKKNGVAVEFTAYRGGAAAQEALSVGTADIIIAAPAQAALAVGKGIKQKIVGVVTTAARGWHIVVLKDSPIQSVKDLAGKSVGVTTAGGLTDIYLAWATQQVGVTAKSVPVGASGLIPSLKGKQVDAASMHSPLPYELLLNGEGRSIFDVAKDMPPAIPEVWVATQSLIDKNPKAIEAVMRSAYEGVAYLASHRNESLEFVKKYTGATDPKIIATEADVVISGMPTSARIERKWLDFALTLGKFGGIDKLPPIEQIYTTQFETVSAK